MPGAPHTRTLGTRQVAQVRLWSVHPKYLDARGLVALWREGLLAQSVLNGKTNGYLHHPQLLRFQEQRRPIGFIAEYLRAVQAEAVSRGYRFAVEKIGPGRVRGHLIVSRGQLEFEWRHLMAKLAKRDPQRHARLATLRAPRPHPLFRVVRGEAARWEKGALPTNTAPHSTRRKRRAVESRR